MSSPATSPIYLDYNATTPVDPRVLERMLPYFCQDFGNSGSRIYGRGLKAEAAIEAARAELASLIGARPLEITFTSGATESNNLALLGVAEAWEHDCHLVVSSAEHPAVLAPARHLATRGVRLTVLPVESDGRVSPDRLRSVLDDDRTLVSIMHANNEIGVLNPVSELAAVCRERGALFHCDASQSIGKVPFDLAQVDADLVSLSGHKFYGPKGVGALVVRRRRDRIQLRARVHGGGQERDLRPGTLNVPGIVGLGAAAAVAGEELEQESARLTRMRRRFLAELRSRLDGVTLNGSEEHRLPGALHLGFEGLSAESLQFTLQPVVELSAGSACSTGSTRPSHVLQAIGLSDADARRAIRLALGRFTSDEDASTALDEIVAAVGRCRSRQGTS